MANMNGAANFRNLAHAGKQAALPPKSPFPTMSPSYVDIGFGHISGVKGNPRVREGQRHHQRTSSESFLIEEQPSWFDELLDEPETPVKKGAHRRSSSDSFAYTDAANIYSNVHDLPQEEHKHRGSALLPAWETQEVDHLRDVQHSSYYTEVNLYGMPQSRGWESAMNGVPYPSSLPATTGKSKHQISSCAMKESHATASGVNGKHDSEGSNEDSSERRDGSHPKHSQSEVDPKRVKQQFAQRSRVRKLQYIAELERNVQALQAEEMEVAAQLDFVDRQNLILNLENKTLKQRLENLAQEHLIKRLQQEMLEHEIARLRALYHHQQQQPQQQPTSNHGPSSSRDLNSQFANLSLKHKEVDSAREPVSSPLHI